MVILRATQKVLRYLPAPSVVDSDSDTALGDWYANRVVFNRHPFLLLVSARSLLATIIPARDVRDFPLRLADTVSHRLRRLGVAEHWVERESEAMQDVVVAKTNDRSVLGTMNDFANIIPFYLGESRMRESLLWAVEEKLAEIPCRVTRRLQDSIHPARKAVELLEEKWKGN